MQRRGTVLLEVILGGVDGLMDRSVGAVMVTRGKRSVCRVEETQESCALECSGSRCSENRAGSSPAGLVKAFGFDPERDRAAERI